MLRPFTAETPVAPRKSGNKCLAPDLVSARPRRLGGETKLSEHFRISLGKESVVQAPDYFGRVVFFYHEGQINFGGALRDHADLHILKNAEDLGGDSGCFAQIFAYQTDDRLSAFVFYVRQFCQIGGQRRDGFIGLGGHRDADFGSGNHVHRYVVVVEGRKMDFKYPCTSRRRGEAISTSVIFFLSAMALKILVQRGARAVTFVPSQVGFSEFRT